VRLSGLLLSELISSGTHLFSGPNGEALAGFLLIIAIAAVATALAAWLVRRFSPDAAGSGIPVVEAELGEKRP